jgi:hypothetical protein
VLLRHGVEHRPPRLAASVGGPGGGADRGHARRRTQPVSQHAST